MDFSKISKAAYDVLVERERQTSGEGWTRAHDDQHWLGEMAVAAACYAIPPARVGFSFAKGVRETVLRAWPWSPDWWKPSDRRGDLVKAGALIIAEIERLDRAADFEAERVLTLNISSPRA